MSYSLLLKADRKHANLSTFQANRLGTSFRLTEMLLRVNEVQIRLPFPWELVMNRSLTRADKRL